MDSYTITIAPNDDSGAATRLVVDASGDQVRITDVHLHAPQGLSSGHIPTVDFDLLLQAVTGSVTASNGAGVAGTAELSAPRPSTPALGAAVATEPAEAATAPAAPKGRARKATRRPATTPTARPGRARAATAGSVDAPSTARKVGKAPAKAARAKTPARKRAAAPAKSQAPAKRTRAAGTTASGRVYRRTPDDLAAVFEQVETVAGVAAHYQVPRHTAQGWVSRLRATT